EVLATSDLPGGVVNILTGLQAALAPPLAAHMDVNAIDLTGATDPDLALPCEREATENPKRVVRPSTPDWTAEPGGERRKAFPEAKPIGHRTGVGSARPLRVAPGRPPTGAPARRAVRSARRRVTGCLSRATPTSP